MSPPYAHKRIRPQLEDIEPRILYSADVAALYNPQLAAPSAEIRMLDLSVPTPPAAAPVVAQTTSNEIVFVNTDVQNYQALVNNITQNADSTRNIQVVLLDSHQSGIDQISAALQGQHDISAIHLIAHGSDGDIELGNTQLNAQTLNANGLAIADWGKALNDNGDILIYGCNLAQTDTGKSFVNKLANLTLGDVAASDDLTGDAAKGGDWDLEYQAGNIETRVVIDLSGQKNWLDLLVANSAPTLALPNGAVSFTEDASAVSVDSAASVVDSELTALNAGFGDYAGSSLVLMRNGSANPDDSFGFDTTGGIFSVSGSNLQSAGLTFATFTNSGGALTINFTSSGTIATQYLVDQVMQLTQYTNTNQNPPTSVQLDWSFDDGNAGAQGTGGALFDIKSTTVNITAVNDAPVNTAPASYTTLEDTAFKLTGLSVSDVDAAAGNITVTLSVSNGTLVAANAGGVTVAGSTTNSIVLTGTLANINTYLATVANQPTYTPTLNFNGTDSLTMLTNDGGNTGSGGALTDIDPVTINITAVDDAPTATNLSAAQTYTEDTVLGLTTIVVSDVDSANVTVTLTLSNIAAGSINTGTSGAVTSTFAAGVWSATGAVADVNTLLAGLTFTPTLNFNSNFNITTSVDDGVAAAVTGTKVMTGTPVDDAPTATNLSAAQTYTEDTTLGLTAIVVSDVDSANVTVTLTLSNIAAGGISTATSGAVTSTFAAGVWTATGALTDVNTLLAGLTFTPTLNFNSNFNINTSVSDGTTTVTGTKVMTGTPVNDAPTATNLSAAETYTEDTALGLTAIVVSDVDSANVTVTLTLSNIAAGSINTGTSGAVTSTFAAGVWSATGAVADVNTLLAGLTFTPTLDFNSNFNIATSVDDGVAAAVTGTKVMTGTPVDDAPTATNLSAAQTYTEDTALGLTAIVVSDVDSANVTVTLTLSNIAAGTINTATSGAVTSTFAAGVWTASGAIADVNTLLAGLTFTPTLNFNSNFNITTSVDDGVTTLTGTKVMTGTAVNDAPTATNLSAAQTYTEDTALGLTAIVVSDVDSANVTVTLTLSNIAAGSINTGTSGAVTSTFAAGVWSATGAVADVNTLLAGLTFTPTLNFNSNFNITTSVDDGVAAAVTGTKVMTGTPVDDAPTATNLSAAQAYTEDTAFGVTAIVVSDIDSANVTVTLTLSNIAAGGISTATSGAVTSTFAAGVWTATGALTDVNTLLAGLTFTPTLNFNSNFNINTSVSDGTTTVTGTKVMTGTPVNDAPVNTVPASYTTLEDTAFKLTGLSVSDVDAAAGTITVTLSVSNGTLVAANAGGVTVAGSTTNSIVLTGTLANINTYLATVANQPTYTPTLNYNGTDTLTMLTNDGGNTGGGALTDSDPVTINITAVNDPPVLSNLAGDSSGYAIGSGAQIVDQGAAATALDPDVNYNGGNLTVSLAAGGVNAEDILAIRNQGMGAGQIGAAAGTVYYSGVAIGTYVGGTAGANLVITLNAAADNTAVTALMQNITFQNTNGSNPIGGDRTVRFVLTDNAAATSGNIDATVTVQSLTVDTASDVSDGNTSSLAALWANKGADGKISLREAIAAANASAGSDTIRFQIGTGAQTINIASALPIITDTIIIDGTTQSGYVAGIFNPISLDGGGVAINGLALSNAATGSTIKGLVIGNFNGHGLMILNGSNNNVIQGNFIGSFDNNGNDLGAGGNSANGIIILAATGNTIGGATAAQRNLIGGNNLDGIDLVGSTSNTIQGNYIGTDVTGTGGVGNNKGILLSSGATSNIITGNLISGNVGSGIELGALGANSSNTISSNLIGTTITGTTALANTGDGIRVGFGGTANNAIISSNTIAFNGGDGISLIASTSVRIQTNLIFSNTGLGIDLTNDGVTLNDLGDADTGANNLQNFPVITSVVFNGANLAITGTFNSNASTSYSVEFFGNPAGNVDASGHGEARVYLGVITFTTDASGNASFSTTVVPSGLVVGDFVTATARRLGGGGGDTSEFALNTIISPNTAPVISSNGGGATAAVSVTALTTAVTTVTASDAGGLAATPFSFGVGPDNGFFTLNTTTGVLTFTVPPALGATPDFNGDGVYQVTIIVTDAGGLTDTQQIFVSVIAAPGVGTPNATGNPLITGTVTENQTLTATNGTIADANGIGAFNYQWFRDASSTFSASSVAIAGATHSTYTLGNADVGQYMFVRVVYQDGGGNLETLVSAATTQVAGVNDAPSFNVGTGSLIQVIGAADDVGNSVAVQVDGKILVAGYSDSATNKDFAITRYNADGSLDTSFGTAGIAIIAVGTGDDFTTSIVLQNDGKILVAGYARVGGNYDFALVRLNSNGTLDGTFGTAGKVTTPIGAAGDIANNVVLQADGKILLVGASFNGSNDDFAVVRYTAAGVLDTSFGAGNGIAITAIGAGNDSAQSVIVQNDGRIVVAGNSFNGSNNDFAVVRYTTAGTLDTTFGTTGIITADVNGSQDVAYSVALQQDGKIVVAGYSANGSNNDFSLVRYNANGILDGTFGTGGKVVTTVGTGDDLGYSLVVQSDGAIVVAGYAFNGTDNDVALVRYTSSGALDATFGVGGKVITSVAADQIGYNLQLQSDGKLVLAGYSDNGTDNDFSLLRYNTNGTLDTQFNLTGTTLGGVRAFTEGAGAALGTAVVLDGNVTLFDAELSAANNFNGATLTLVRNGGTNVDDVFSGLGGFAAIGTVTTNSGGTLLITLNSFATNALLNTAMQQITYANSSQDPPASVQIDWSFDDGNAGAQGTGAGVATGSVTVNITAVNDTPINNVPASYTTDEDITLALTGLSITDVDARVGSLTVTLTVTNGTLTVSGGSAGIAGSGTSTVTLTGTITAINATLAATVNYVPTANYNGSATLTMGVNDGGNTGTGGAKTDSDVINITINSVNDAPAGTNKTITFNEDAAYTFSAADFGFSDVNDAPNTFSAVTITTLPLLGVLTLGGVPVLAGDSIPVGSIGTLVYTPVADANGAAYASFTFQVQDNGGTANSGVDIDPTPNTITFNVTAVNDAPINTVPGAQSTNEDITLAITGLSIVDVDAAASSVTVTLIVTNGTLTVSGGTAGIAGSGTSTVTLTGTVTQINATLAATVNYVPTANYNGSATLTMGVNDGGNTGTGGAKTDSDVINITINSVNDAPAGTNKTITTLEDTAYTFTVADFGFSDVNDAPNTLLNVRITTLPLTGSLTLTGFGAVTAGQFVLATDIAAGKLIYTPVTDANGLANASFTFQVQDNGGTAFSGIDLDPSANTISIDVTSVNDAPIGTNNTVTTNEDTVYTFAVADFGFTDPNDTPTNSMTGVRITTLPTAGTLTLTGVGAVTAGQIITVANITAGKLIFTPALNANGVAYSTFTFQVQDNGGVASGGVNQDTTARTMTIDVTAVNDAPINNGLVAQTTNEDTSKTITGLSITDVDAASASITTTLSVLNGVLNVSGGTATITNSGTNTVTLTGTVAQINATLAATVSYVPTANYNGSDTLTMVTSDNGNTGSGGTLTDTDAVSITINSVNDAPSGTDNTISTNEDTAQTFTVADFGFSDVIDSNSLTGVRITTLPLTGSLTLSGVAVTAGQTITLANITGGNLKFTPAANANGLANASFTFQVQDSGGTAFGGVDLDPSANTMTIDVNSVNDAPTGTNNTITTNEDTAHTFTLAEFGFADSLDSPANNAFQVKITTLPALGSLKLNGVAVTAGQFVLVSDITSGLLVYTPALNGNSAAYTSFTFQVQDDGGTALGGIDLDPVDNTITINVTAVNDAPVITNGSTVTLTGTNEDTTSSGTLVSTILAAAGYSDVDVSALSGIAIIGKMRNGSFEYSTDGISWRNFGAAPLSTSSALLLTSGTQIRYIPDQQNGETATLTFQAWDQTTDTASDNATPRYGNITGSGGTAAYSTGIATISITVNDLNDAPLLNSGFVYNLPGTDENTPNDAVLIKVSDILSAPGSGYSDVDTGSSLSYGIAVTGAFRNGSFQYSTDGTTWTSGVLNSATPANALLLDSSTYIRYVPDGKNGEIAATFTFRVWDRTVGTASNFGTQSYANASSTGLTFAFSANTGTASVAVSDVPDAPVIGSDGGLATASINAFDDTNAVTTVIATDVDIGSTLTFSKAGGVDASFFNLDPNTGVLTFISIPDSFNPLDSNADNVYHVVVQVIDNTGLIDTQSIAVTVVPTTNKAPVIDNNGGGTTGGGATASVNFAENTATAVATVHATDPDALDTVTYSISGADAALFTINPTTGVLTFNSPPDFENKLDNDSNNSYIVTVTATDNGSPNRRDTQIITINVTPVNDNAPVMISSATFTMSENSVDVTPILTANKTIEATDADLDVRTYSIVGGVDASKFTLNSATGHLSFVIAPDFEAPTDVGINNVYNLTVQASDGTFNTTQNITVTVLNGNDAPVAVNDASSGNAGTAQSGAVLGNDSDQDTNALVAVLATGPAHGSVTLNANGTYTYTPTPGFSGSDSFTYRATDGALNSNLATVSLTVVFVAPIIPIIPPPPPLPPVPTPTPTAITPPLESDIQTQRALLEAEQKPKEESLISANEGQAVTQVVVGSGVVIEAPKTNNNTSTDLTTTPIQLVDANLAKNQANGLNGAFGSLSGNKIIIESVNLLGGLETEGGNGEQGILSKLSLQKQVQLSGTAASLGLVFWALNSGAIISSVVASSPSWTDPISLLDDSDAEVPDEDEDENTANSEEGAADMLSQ